MTQLLHFKLGFSERRFAVHTIRFVLDEAAYGRLTEAAGGGARNGYFPAYSAPRPATTAGANAEAEAEAAAARA